MQEKKFSWLFSALVAVLALVLVVIVGVAISKNTGKPPIDTGTPNSSQVGSSGTEGSTTGETDSTTESESASESESDTQDDPIEPPGPQGNGSEVFVMFGVDSRSNQLGKGTRSDSIMLISVNHDTKQVNIVSIYRDCMLYQEGKGYKKISNAHSYGGPTFARDVINENLDLNIEKYCTVNFAAVTELVDTVGGVEVQMSLKEIQTCNASLSAENKIQEEAGTHLLNGEQALIFSRIRKGVGNDYARTERQREVLFAVFEKAKAMGDRKRLEIVEQMIDKVNTNYKEDELLILMYYMSEYEIKTMTAYPRVFYGGIVSNWVEVPWTLIDMNADIHKILLGVENYTPSKRVEEISAALIKKANDVGVTKPNINQKK